MCLSIPGKIKSIENDMAVVDINGISTEANISIIEDPKVGDYLLVHAGFAIEKYDDEDAKETLRLVKEKMERDAQL